MSYGQWNDNVFKRHGVKVHILPCCEAYFFALLTLGLTLAALQTTELLKKTAMEIYRECARGQLKSTKKYCFFCRNNNFFFAKTCVF